MTTGEKIALMRKNCGITQEQLSEKLDVSRQSVSRWEKDIAFPEISKLVKLGKILDCSVDYLLNEDIQMYNNSQSSVSIYESYKFIQECSFFFLATCVDNTPSLRPMGWIYANDKALYIATDKRKKVYSDLMNNPKVEMASYNINTRKWIRVSGNVEIESSKKIEKEIVDLHPLIRQKFKEKEGMYCVILKINVENIHIDS